MPAPISIDGFKAPSAPEPGPAPMLQWIRIANLVVEERYQRRLHDQGRRNVQRIASAFRWTHFAPVIVAPIEGGMFAIVDGQHRTTAAALCGIDSVPCQVIVADTETQAAAFAAINGNVTKISPMQLHHAAVAAGEPSASLLAQACAIAEVELLRYPIPKHLQKPGQTMAVGAAQRCFAQYGRDTLITALQCVTQTESNNQPGVLSSFVIRALCTVLDKRRDWRDAGEKLFQAFEQIDIASCEDAARLAASQSKGMTTGALLAEALERELAGLMPNREAAE